DLSGVRAGGSSDGDAADEKEEQEVEEGEAGTTGESDDDYVEEGGEEVAIPEGDEILAEASDDE
ncbi:MAG TPA: hypothetical protein VJ689_04405, partial [Gaiellaceae bacterium]|nr:hypothetical protein [Gaiellaceae bacterium]